MTPFKFNFLFIAFIGINATIGLAQPDVKADEKIIAHLKKFRSEYIKSMLEKRPEIVQSYYAENIRLMPEFQKTVMGKSNVLLYNKAFSSRFDIQEYTRNEIEILDLGVRVVELGMFSMKIKLKSTGKEHNIKGKYENFREKTSNLELVLITEAWNYNHQLEIEGQLKFEEVPEVTIALQPHVPINNKISFELAALNKLMEAAISQHDAKIWSQFYTDDGSTFTVATLSTKVEKR